MCLLFRRLCKSGPLMEQRDHLSCVLELKHTKNRFMLKPHVVHNSLPHPVSSLSLNLRQSLS